MKYDALLVIDVQTGLVEDHPYNEEKLIANILHLMGLCRDNHIPVIFVQHDGGMGDELAHGTDGWTIWKELSPMEGEIVIEKRFNSAFRQTGLREYMNQINAENIVLCGMQSEHCMDATCKVAFEYGYHITIVEDTTSTFDNEFASGQALAEYYQNKIWNHRYANVISMEQFKADL